MAVREAEAVWRGSLQEGAGSLRFGTGEYAYDGPYTFSSRFEEAAGTNPEELIGAAHAGCFSMALSGELGKAGYEPVSIETQAKVRIERVDGAQTITQVALSTVADVPGIESDEFMERAETAKANCPVSRALTGVEIVLAARLAS